MTARCVLLLVFGVVALGLRVVSVFMPRVSLTVLSMLFGGFALADGVISIAIGLWRIKRGQGVVWALFLRGALGIGLGVFALGASLPVVALVARLVASWAFVSGVLDLAIASGMLRGAGGRLLGVAGGVSVIVAAILGVWPPSSIPFLVLWVAGYGVLEGILLLIRVTRLS
ncbi:MAG TPA: DUF308 domain-containing protein [Candidatus Methylomirabilis sp.]|nr:DUF308 domain-containing protein [Candidatus Methylomirabilis sp.]